MSPLLSQPEPARVFLDMPKIVLKPPYLWAWKNIINPGWSTSGQAKGNVDVDKAGAHELRSHLTISNASDCEMAGSLMSTMNLMKPVKAPGKAPLKVRMTFDPVVALFDISIDNECGFSALAFSSSLQIKVQTFVYQKGVYSIGQGGIGFATTDVDWGSNWWISPKRKLVGEFEYFDKNINDGDLLWFSVGLEINHHIRVDDVSVSSLLDVTAFLNRVEIST